jgi:hypothetical protein
MRSRKIIKKLVQSTVILLLIVFAIPASAFLLLQSSRIQTSVANRIMQIVSEKLNTRFTIRKIDISFLYRVRLNDVYLEDLSGDTMLYVQSMTAGIRYINPIRQEVSIGSINFEKAFVALAIDSANIVNISYFIDKLKGNGKGKGGWNVRFNNLSLRNSRFSLKNFYYHPTEYGMNYTDIQAFDIDADIKRFYPSKDSLSFFIKSLQVKERSGLKIKYLSADFSQSRTFLSFRNIVLKTPDSDIEGNEISLRFKDWGDFKAGSFIKAVRLRISLSHAKFNLGDLGYFASAFQKINQTISFSGQVNGPVSNMKGKDLVLTFGNNSKLVGEVSLEGLPTIRETFILADIDELTTSAGDIEVLQLPGRKRIRLPGQVRKLGLITYKGNYTGFFNDFVAYGRFRTSLGIVNTDLLFRPDTSNLLDFEGKLNVQNFDLGTLLDASKNIGKISLTATISGATLTDKSIDAALKGVIERFEFRQYEYKNINLSGNLQDKTFNGSVDIKDPNIELEFLGKVNLSDSVPTFNFTANVTDANLYALNIDKSDPDFRVSCYLIANARGNSINSLNGEIKLLNSLFTRKQDQLQIYDFSILTENKSGDNRMQLRSDFLDADLSGNYELTKVSESLKQFFYSYLPSLLDSADNKTMPLQNKINFSATLKNTKPLFDFFLPDYSIAENSTVNLAYTPASKQMQFQFQTSHLVVKSLVWNKMNVIINGSDSALELEAGGSDLTLGNRIKLDNFTILSRAAGDTAGINMRWNNWQDLQYRGSLSALAKVSRQAGQHFPHIEISLHPTTIITNDTLWNIQPGQVSIDSNNIRFNNLAINHKNEYFRLDGALSKNPSDKMNILFNHFNLSNLNGITMSSGFKLGGILNGKATISDIYANKLFTSLLKIDSLMINNEMLGNAEISSKWDDDRKTIDLEANAMRDNLKTVNIKGEYIPAEQGKLAFNLELNKLRLNLFNPYVRVIFSDLRGMASGKASLTGTLSKPMLNGELNLQKSTFTVNYLKTRYNFTEKVQIENNNIYFKDIRIYDPEGNSAYLSGAIRNKYLKNFQFDLTIRSQDFLCMNTTQSDNKLFYGTAYASGDIRIYGPPKNITMDITATTGKSGKTGKNTSISIPVNSEGKLDDYPFITIYNENSGNNLIFDNSDFQVNLSGLQINFNLIVTPDAEVQIIFDPKLGDKIKGRGHGNLDMKINTSGDFKMYGDYTIEKGNYLFTLKSIINKDLIIEPGGTIRWNGDPFNADINIVAYYRTKASLNDLYGTQEGYSSKIWVNDRITMTGKLMKPDVKYDIFLPDADESTRLSLSNAINSSDELNKQFISILAFNRFMPGPNVLPQTSGNTSSSSYSGAAGVSASELLSNQLSHWLSQINNDVDVGISYRSDRQMKSDEVQLALSTQLFNDRLTINGSVDVATNATANATDEIVGEFDIDYKLRPNGKLRLKTYNHANNDMLYENSTYTQGFGFSYKEEFDTVGELWRRLFRSVFGKKEEEPKPITPAKTDSTVNK